MKILCISDTHGQHKRLKDLPEADVLVHCGDFTQDGSQDEAMDFMEWFFVQPYEYKVFVAGNHDLCLYNAKISGLPDKCYFLNGSSVEVNGLKFHGIPLFMQDVVDGNYDLMIRSIPDDVDVLVTHQPPLCIMSGDFGDIFLLNRVKAIQPRLHLFGHAHEYRGQTEKDGTTYVNSALLSRHYEMKYEPILVEV